MIVTRIRLPLVLSLLLFASACAHTTQPGGLPEAPPPRPVALVEQAPGGCPPVPVRSEAPIVCVDDTGAELTANPPTVEAFDRHPEDRAPVNILWFTKSGGGDLRIQMKDDHCVGKVWCNPKTGHCRAKTLPFKPGADPCKYDVWIEGGPQKPLDPYVVIRECCA